MGGGHAGEVVQLDPGTQRLASVQMPESGTTTYGYNADGTMKSKTDAKGQRTRDSYDAYQQVAKTEVDLLVYAGFTPDAGYRAGVSTRTFQVISIETFLGSPGLLPGAGGIYGGQ